MGLSSASWVRAYAWQALYAGVVVLGCTQVVAQELQEVVVTAERREEKLQDVAIAAGSLWVAAADPSGKQLLWEARLDGPLAVVVGAEGAGVRPGVLKHCDLRLRIPMGGQVGSLNASVSAALVLYEVARQRALGAGRSP